MAVSLIYIIGEIFLPLFLCIFFVWCLININGLPWNWPVVGMLPSLFCHLHRVHHRCVDILKLAGGTFHLKGPSFANSDIIITADPTNVHFIMSSNFANFPKGPHFKEIFDVLGDGIFNADSDLWACQRKQARALIAHDCFRRFLIRTTSEKVRHGLIPVLEHVCNNSRGIVVDLQDLFQRFTFDTTCVLVTGYDPGCLSVGLPDVPFSRALDEAEEAIFMRHCLPESLWKLQRFLGLGHEKQLIRARVVLDSVIEKYISAKREEITARKSGGPHELGQENGLDLLSSYINESENDNNSSLRDTILNFMIAGRDTTSSALTWFVWLVSTHPEVEKKIRDELNSVIPEDSRTKLRLFEADEVRNLVYLHAALCESLRLYPPVPFQHKAPARPVVLPSGHYAGPEMKILFSLYAMGRMEYIWGKDSGEFKPERWITERGTVKHEPSYKFLAFNAGPRTCLGKEVAFTQLKCVAAAIIHNYQIEVVKGHNVSPNVSIILYMKHGLKVRVTKRLD
ncbi:hypothetical protein ABFS83_12G005400 [Erythranthe nasuta]